MHAGALGGWVGGRCIFKFTTGKLRGGPFSSWSPLCSKLFIQAARASGKLLQLRGHAKMQFKNHHNRAIKRTKSVPFFSSAQRIMQRACASLPGAAAIKTFDVDEISIDPPVHFNN